MRFAFSSAPAAARRAPATPHVASATLPTATAAWVAAIPTAAITLLAIMLLGEPLGALLFPAPSARFWPSLAWSVRPEPTEQARFLIALTAPLLLAGFTTMLARRAPRRVAAHGAAIAAGAEWTAVLFAVACFVAQRLQEPQTYVGQHKAVVYFTVPSILVAVAIGAGIALAARSPAARARVAGWTRESPARAIASALVAVVALAIAVLPAIHTDASIATSNQDVAYHLYFTYDEALAVVDGRSPLGDFAAQYSSLWPYAFAAAMAVLGSSLTAFTGLAAALTSAMLLALYAVLRRLTRSSVAAVLLFLPLLATFGLRLHGPATDRFSLMNYFGVVPLRYAGPLLLAWLTARHLDGARPRRIWPLFLAGGLIAINNPDFGLGAVAATLAALIWARPRRGRADVRRDALEALAGAGGAVVLVTAVVLARTGALPDPSLMFRYAHTFAVEGFAMATIRPLFGIDLVVYLTYVAAVGVATVRALSAEHDRLLTGMLAWSGVFGLAAGSYYVGHSISELLVYMLPAWALAVTLLSLTAIHAIARSDGRVRPGQLACLVGLGLVVCSLGQLPQPGPQLRRIAASGTSAFGHPAGERLVAQYARPGEPVLILGYLGHRIAVNVGVDDVDPVTGARSVFTVEQLAEALATLRDAGGEKVFVLASEVYPGLLEALRRRYELRTQSESGMQLWLPR